MSKELLLRCQARSCRKLLYVWLFCLRSIYQTSRGFGSYFQARFLEQLLFNGAYLIEINFDCNSSLCEKSLNIEVIVAAFDEKKASKPLVESSTYCTSSKYG